ncbi:Squamosa promoter-binding-like protein [Musa troglodytarum]|uniref:Squamosa promoter-binding-like protein n=1 Tax=Musa troglodytarum TaxID=320322 RepID=A0A9E7KKM1_9LILI|nr:Squamosa promoter-binding-like protein [Musa troglodytarum]
MAASATTSAKRWRSKFPLRRAGVGFGSHMSKETATITNAAFSYPGIAQLAGPVAGFFIPGGQKEPTATATSLFSFLSNLLFAPSVMALD